MNTSIQLHLCCLKDPLVTFILTFENQTNGHQLCHDKYTCPCIWHIVFHLNIDKHRWHCEWHVTFTPKTHMMVAWQQNQNNMYYENHIADTESEYTMRLINML